jgi:hypothetical protein
MEKFFPYSCLDRNDHLEKRYIPPDPAVSEYYLYFAGTYFLTLLSVKLSLFSLPSSLV